MLPHRQPRYVPPNLASTSALFRRIAASSGSRPVTALRYLIDAVEAYATFASSSTCGPVAVSTLEATAGPFILSVTSWGRKALPAGSSSGGMARRPGAQGLIRVREAAYVNDHPNFPPLDHLKIPPSSGCCCPA
jgi:hypothetical protein